MEGVGATQTPQEQMQKSPEQLQQEVDTIRLENERLQQVAMTHAKLSESRQSEINQLLNQNRLLTVPLSAAQAQHHAQQQIANIAPSPCNATSRRDCQPRTLSTAEVAANKGTLEPHKITQWMDQTTGYLLAKLQDKAVARALLYGDDAAWRRMQRVEPEVAEAYSSWMASTLLQCLDADSTYVTAFKRAVLKSNAEAMSDGRQMVQLMLSRVESHPGEDEARIKKYDKQSFFKMGMQPHEVELGAQDLQDMRATLPDWKTSRRNDGLRALLESMPSGSATLSRRVECDDADDDAARRGGGATLLAAAGQGRAAEQGAA